MMLRSVLTQFLVVFLTIVILLPGIISNVQNAESVNFIGELLVLLMMIGILNYVASKVRYYFSTQATERFNSLGNCYTRKNYYMDMLGRVESQKDIRIYNQQTEVNDDILHICKNIQEQEREHNVNYMRRDSVTVLNTA